MQVGILKEHAAFLKFMLRAFDLVVVVLSALLARAFSVQEFVLGSGDKLAIALGVVLCAVVFDKYPVYGIWRGLRLRTEVVNISLAWAGSFIALFAIYGATDLIASVSRDWLIAWFCAGWALFALSRVTLRISLRWIRAQGYNQRHIVIVGSGRLAAKLDRHLKERPWLGLQATGFFDDRDTRHAFEHDLPKLGGFSDLASYVAQRSPDQVWLALPLRAEKSMRRVVHELRHAAVTIRFVPDIFGLQPLNPSVSEVEGIPTVTLSTSPIIGINRTLKALEDRVFALLILLLATPLMLAITIGVKLSSPGPVLYRQKRIGWGGQSFTMFKFRTMPVGVEAKSGPVWSRSGENRATAFGSFLRKTSLDELPQFFNVLTGEMSIVGPRPERPVFVEKFKEQIPGYMKKHMVKPGITGWAQIQGWRGNSDLSKRIECDLFYIRHWSVGFDIWIIFMTLFKGFLHENAH